MKSFRLILSEPTDGYENMAIDESIFLYRLENRTKYSSLRIYSWAKPCMTIGYFQKYSEFECFKLPIIRRLTGGLAVSHYQDISYSFVTNEMDWPYIYNQKETYHLIHKGIMNGLRSLGIEVSIPLELDSPIKSGNDRINDNLLCSKTFYPYDLMIGNKKILGSCQRRRGKTLIQQGSIHMQSKYDLHKISNEIIIGFEKELKCNFKPSCLENSELLIKDNLIKNKYTNSNWNKKF